MGLDLPHRRRARLRLGAPIVVEHALASRARDRAGGEQAVRAGGGSIPEVNLTHEEIEWREGEAFVWDDSFAHEVYWPQAEDDRGGDERRETVAVNAVGSTQLAGRDCDETVTQGRDETEDLRSFAASLPRIILLLTFSNPDHAKDVPGDEPAASDGRARAARQRFRAVCPTSG